MMTKHVGPRCTMWVSSSVRPDSRIWVKTLTVEPVGRGSTLPVTYAARQPFQRCSSIGRSVWRRKIDEPGSAPADEREPDSDDNRPGGPTCRHDRCRAG